MRIMSMWPHPCGGGVVVGPMTQEVYESWKAELKAREEVREVRRVCTIGKRLPGRRAGVLMRLRCYHRPLAKRPRHQGTRTKAFLKELAAADSATRD